MSERAKTKIDLHMHTEASDGSWDPAGLLAKLQAAGVDCFAITDHDMTNNIESMKPLADRAGLRFIPGIEVSSWMDGIQYHITAYGCDLANPPLVALLAENRRRLTAQQHRIIQYFADTRPQPGLSVAEFETYQFTKPRVGYRNLSYLLEIGAVKDIGDYFGTVSHVGFPVEHVPPAEAIAAIRGAGGHAFLAHPPAYRKGTRLSHAELDLWREMGISGIECYSHYFKSVEDSVYYVDYSSTHDLQISGGSDFHGWTPDTSPGTPPVFLDQLRLAFL